MARRWASGIGRGWCLTRMAAASLARATARQLLIPTHASAPYGPAAAATQHGSRRPPQRSFSGKDGRRRRELESMCRCRRRPSSGPAALASRRSGWPAGTTDAQLAELRTGQRTAGRAGDGLGAGHRRDPNRGESRRRQLGAGSHQRWTKRRTFSSRSRSARRHSAEGSGARAPRRSVQRHGAEPGAGTERERQDENQRRDDGDRDRTALLARDRGSA